MTTIDWKSLRQTAEDSARPLPPDWYDVVCDKAEATVASTGSDMLKVTLRVTGGPHDGRPLWTNFVLTPDNGFALNIFFRNVQAFGVDPAIVAPAGSLAEVALALIGRTARAQVGVRTWQGQERNEIVNVVPSGTAQVPVPGAGSGPALSGPVGPAVSVPSPSSPSPMIPAPTVPGPSHGPVTPGPVAPPEPPF